LQAAEITPNPLSKFPEREGDDMPGQNEIRRRAYEIYLEYGEQPGGELDDWLRAEREFNKALVLEAIDTLFNQRDYVKA
jgi:DNA relaxase NicK